jgi:hypothetical protein
MNPIAIAAKGKGSLHLLHRAGTIGSRYGLGPGRIERRVATVLELIERFSGRATLPVTAAAVQRNPRALTRFAESGIEFAIHGLYHVDHIGVRAAAQCEQFGRAQRLLTSAGLAPVGFRAPYLRWSDHTLVALRESGFEYDSSQAMHWPFEGRSDRERYTRALAFYDAVSALDLPSLPRMEHGIVRIPYCLPDDEAVVERLRLSPQAIARLWVGMFRSIHERGEVFTLAVHPERIDACADGIAEVLQAASAAWPPVWFARLDELARWWRERSATEIEVVAPVPGLVRVVARGPAGLSIQARGLTIDGAEPWRGGYALAPSSTVEVRSERRPFIGVHPSSASGLAPFLRAQGYIVESTDDASAHSVFLRIERFVAGDELGLLSDLERGTVPLVRLGRWPNGAGSALCLTGDLDALTIWDYALRAFGQ